MISHFGKYFIVARHLPAPKKNRIYTKKRWLPWLPRL